MSDLFDSGPNEFPLAVFTRPALTVVAKKKVSKETASKKQTATALAEPKIIIGVHREETYSEKYDRLLKAMTKSQKALWDKANEFEMRLYEAKMEIMENEIASAYLSAQKAQLSLNKLVEQLRREAR